MKPFLVTILSFSMPLVANAFPVMKALEKRLPTQRVARAEACANFSGNWKGTCTVAGEALADAQHTKIEQFGCELLSTDGNVTALGGFNALSFMAPLSDNHTLGVTVQSSAAWNGTYSEIHYHFGGTLVGTQKQGVSFDGNGVAKMNGTQLVFDGTIAGVAVSCTYDRE